MIIIYGYIIIYTIALLMWIYQSIKDKSIEIEFSVQAGFFFAVYIMCLILTLW